MVKVVSINEESISFDDGSSLCSDHYTDCCEHHYLDFSHHEAEFDGLDFDLSSDNFFERVDGYGIRLIPTNGHPVSVPGYGYNNGYYSDTLTLILSRPNETDKKFDITECQEVSG